METGIPASFIPSDTIDTTQSRRQSAGLPELALLVSIVLFVASGALAAGVFLYAQYLQTASASKVQQLERAKEAFKPSLIEQLMRLNDRMLAADTILGNHLAPSAFFDALQAATLSTVSFSGLELQSPDARTVTIRMAGIAQSVNSIALQADLFSKNGVIKDPIFSGIDREPDGVHFDLTAEVDPKAIGFTRTITSGTAQQAAGAAIPVQQGAQQPAQSPQETQQPSPFGTTPNPSQ